MPADPGTLDAYVGRWIGDIRGTHVGHVFAETSIHNGGLLCNFHVNAQGQGLNAYVGSLLEGLPLRFSIQRVLPQAEGDEGHGLIALDMFSPDQISGKWSLGDGSAGLIWLSRVPEVSPKAESIATEPAELVAKEVPLGPVKLYRHEMEAVVSKLNKLISKPAEVIITGTVDGNKISRISSEFFQSNDLPDTLNHVTFSISDRYKDLPRSIVINLNQNGENNLIVQSADVTWTNGVSSDLMALLSRYVSKLASFFVKYGLDLNFLILISSVTMLPGLETIQERSVFMVGVLCVLVIFVQVRMRLQRTTIYLDHNRRRWHFTRELPSILVTVFAGVMVLILWELFQWIARGGSTFLFGPAALP